MCVDQPVTGLPHAHALCMTQHWYELYKCHLFVIYRHTVSTRITKCTKFGQLILRKITKIVATRCQILRLKCTKFDFGWGSAPDPAGGAYSAPPDPLAGFKGPTSKGGEGREGRKGKVDVGRGREEKGGGGAYF